MRKKILVFAAVGIMVIGQCFSVTAAIPAGFTVSSPSQTYFNNQYIVSGGVSYTRPSSGGETTYYLQDKVTVFYNYGGKPYTKSASGYGYNAASAMVEEISCEPTGKTNTGYYKSGATFVPIATKY